MTNVLTPDDIAARWNCSPAHVRRLIQRGELPSFRIGGKFIRVRLDEVEKYECPNTNCSDSAMDGPPVSTMGGSASAVENFKAAT